MNDKGIDRFVISLLYINIIIGFYYNALSQAAMEEKSTAPLFVLLFPFGVAVLQLLRIFTLAAGRIKLNTLSKLWVYIFLYYLFAFMFGSMIGQGMVNYNTIWYLVCPPVAWVYFTFVLKVFPSIKDDLVKWSFWIFIVFSSISLYFIPRSVNYLGFYASLNTGYYVLLAYPMVLLDDNRVKKIIATVLVVIIVLLSMKRGGMLSVAISFALYILFSTKTSIFKKGVVVAVCIGALFYVIPKVNEVSNGTLQARYEFTQNQGDEEGRSSMYPMVWKAVWQSDLAEITFGHGHNAVVSNNILQGLSSHNDYLEFLYDFGVIGLVLLILYQWELFKITRRAYKNKKGFLPSIFAFTTIVVLSMVSIVYCYYYFLVIIPFWCVMNLNQTERRNRNNENRYFNIQPGH